MGRVQSVLPRTFFRTDPLVCAAELIGTTLIWGKCAGRVVEVEAYLTENDEASHTFTRPSARSFVERNRAGTAYVYFNYGVHWMLNVLVKGGPRNGLILIRAIEPLAGIPLMRRRRHVEDIRRLCSGPGKLAQALGISGRDHEMDLCRHPGHGFAKRDTRNIQVVADPRIGISRAKEFPWRFTLAGSQFLSKPGRPR